MSGLRARTGLKVTGGILATLGLAAVMTVSVAAAAPTVNTGSGITVDGNFADWTEADLFADMYRAGDSTKQVESKLYLRYDCTAGILYVGVIPAAGVTIIESNEDNFVKFGNDDKKVDGNASPPPASQPNFAYAPDEGGWEASFAIAAPLAITDLNVHAQVQDDGSQTSAVADRAIAMNITCTELTPTTAAAASVMPASCTAAGTLVVPADTDSVMYSVSPAYTGAAGNFTVTATAKTGFVLTGTSAWALTVAPQVMDATCITGGGTLPGNPSPSPVAQGTLGSSGGPAGGLPNTAIPVELAASLGSLLVIASGIGFSLTRRRTR